MALVSFRQFAGLRPVLSKDLMAPGEAEVAVNCRLDGGDIEPWRALRHITDLPGLQPAQTIYRFGQSSSSESQFWLRWSQDVDVVKGPVYGDTQERTYWTGDGHPKKTDATIATASQPYPSGSYRLGVPAPTGAPLAAVQGTATSMTDPANSVVYVVTYVTAWGEESAPSPASQIVTYRPGQYPRLTALPASLSTDYNATKVRIYRSNSGTESTQFQFVDEVNLGVSQYDDTKDADELGETLPTIGWLPPPDDLRGLCLMANGILAGFSGEEVLFSEPNAPYAWPQKYRQRVDAPVVGCKPFGQSLFVSTARSAFVFTGIDPGAITQEKLDGTLACVSKRGMVEMLGGVVYVARDGLRLVSASGAQLLTEPLMTAKEWAAYKPESMRCYNADGRCLVFYDTGSKQGGLVFSFGSSANMTELDFYASAGFYEGRALYLAVDNAVRRWDDGTSTLTATWRSAPARLPAPTVFACAQVDAEAYPVTAKFIADGQVKLTKTVQGPEPFRLPAGFRLRRAQIELVTTQVVRAATLASSVEELKGA